MSVLQAAKMLALPPPFVLQWERECTADALLIAAQPASEQCIGLMQCSCVLTHKTSPPPPSPSLHNNHFLLSFFLSFCVRVSHMLCPLPSFFPLALWITLPVPIVPSPAICLDTAIRNQLLKMKNPAF